MVGGVIVPGAISLEVLSVSYFSAARFVIVFAIGAGPSTNLGYFLSLGGQTITIDMALTGFGFVPVITGVIDNIRVEIVDNTVILTGRDLSARLIDTEILQTFSNQTSSQIAVSICERQGLTPNVTDTSTPVGQYYELEHVRNALALYGRGTTEWNLLCALAEAEGFSLSVTGTTLNFGPPSAAAVVYVSTTSFMSLVFDVLPNLPSGVTVKSWSSRNKAGITQSAGSGPGVTLVRPNLTAQLAQTLAAQHWGALTSHGVMMDATMPGDLTLQPGMKLVLSGTDSQLDQVYSMSAIRRSIDGHEGFVQQILAYAVSNSQTG